MTQPQQPPIEPDSIEPDSIEPDSKDWTWVLSETCPQCEFDAAQFDVARTPMVTRALASFWSAALRSGPEVGHRTSPGVWSVLEYGCHVRDVFLRFDGRLEQMLGEDAPQFENWDQDATALELAYSEQDPEVVALELLAAGERLAARFETVAGQDWARTGLRSDGAHFTVESFARYFLHDPVHHCFDIGARFEV